MKLFIFFSLLILSGHAFQGCSHGFWKNNSEYWAIYNEDETFYNVFGIGPNDTLLDSLKFKHAQENHLVREAVGALLNAAHPDIDYRYTMENVTDIVRDAYSKLDWEYNAWLLEDASTSYECPCKENCRTRDELPTTTSSTTSTASSPSSTTTTETWVATGSGIQTTVQGSSVQTTTSPPSTSSSPSTTSPGTTTIGGGVTLLNYSPSTTSSSTTTSSTTSPQVTTNASVNATTLANGDGGGSLSPGAISGIVLGTLFGIGAVALTAGVAWRKCKKQ